MTEKVLKQAKNALKSVSSFDDLEDARVAILGRKGALAGAMAGIKDVPPEKRKIFGQEMNALKSEVEKLFAQKEKDLLEVRDAQLASDEAIDITAPALPVTRRGHQHPLTQTMDELESVFSSMGFMVLEGPELESDYYNFETLNIPKDHPARDIQDTFYIKDHPDWVMRTHTSPMQVRTMQEHGAPLRTVIIGRVFRNEATDASHEHTFHQIEGLVVDKGISLAHLKGTLLTMLQTLLGKEVKIRLRPSYFPFTEPSVEIDVSCTICDAAGCSACKKQGWIELLGAGMVHPNVLQAGGVDPEEYTGFAFGTGIERLAMLKYGIEDIRHFHQSRLSFIQQF